MEVFRGTVTEDPPGNHEGGAVAMPRWLHITVCTCQLQGALREVDVHRRLGTVQIGQGTLAATGFNRAERLVVRPGR